LAPAEYAKTERRPKTQILLFHDTKILRYFRAVNSTATIFFALALIGLPCTTVHAQSDWWMDETAQDASRTTAQRDSAQKANEQPISELSTGQRLTYGGSAALQLGSITLIGASPKIGYRVTKNLTAGLGGTYYYSRSKVTTVNSFKLFGASLFARHLILPRIFLHTEAERVSAPNSTPGALQIDPVNLLWVGAGYYTSLSSKMAAGLTLLYDLTENPNSPYSNPDIRAGLTFGF
jgi:hypothetical protein